MNWKSTIVLILAAAVGAGAWYRWEHSQAPTAKANPTVEFLDKSLKADAIASVTIQRPWRVPVVLKKKGESWTVDGAWPARPAETAQLVDAIASLHTRFSPTPVPKDGGLSPYGLEDGAATRLTIVTKDGVTTTLRVGEEPAGLNRYTRPTFVRIVSQTDANGKTLIENGDIVRLGPGLIATLDRPADYFKMRRLFPFELVPKDEKSESTETVESVAADRIRVKGPDGEVVLAKIKIGDQPEWRIESSSNDRLEPEKRRALLAAFTDLWADRFSSLRPDDARTGLEKPEYTIEVSRPGGEKVELEIGKVSSVDVKEVPVPAPPQQQFMPPPKPGTKIVKTEYRYARIPGDGQVFEVKADRLKDILAPVKDLRDPRIARFEPGDAVKIAIDARGKSLVLVRDGDKWRFDGPKDDPKLAAEKQPVNDLLDKLATLEAKGDDVLNKADAKDMGLDPPAASIVVTLEESNKKDAKKKEAKDAKVVRTLTYRIGDNAKKKDSAFIQVVGESRVNAVSADVSKLVDRDSVVYRQRRLLGTDAPDVTSIRLRRDGVETAFTHAASGWTQTAPNPAKLEQDKVAKLAAEIGKLEAVEYVAKAPNADDLDKVYGLAKPTATIAFETKDKAGVVSHVLSLGAARADKDDRYARLDDGPVFVLKKDAATSLERDPLTYRTTQAWQVSPDEIAKIEIKKGTGTFSLARKDKGWAIAGDFSADARPENGDAMADELAELKTEKYVAAVTPKDLVKFGLEPPYAAFTVTVTPKKKPGETTTTVLEIGKRDESGNARYARIGGGDAVFLVGDKALAVLDRGPLELLDHVLLRLPAGAITKIGWKDAEPFTLEKEKGEWQVVGSPVPKFGAETAVVDATLKSLENLIAEKVVGYGDRVDWNAFGLEKPAATVVIASDGVDGKSAEKTIEIGKDAEGGGRFVRIGKQPQVSRIDASASAALMRSYLDFANPRVLKFPFDAVTQIDRVMNGETVELVKRDDAWQMIKPEKQTADTLTVDDVVEKTFQLKAKRVAALVAKDLAKFGLEPPAATVTIHLGDDKSHVIKIGSLVEGKSDERYAQVDGGPAVIVLPAALSKHLTASPQYFADRNLASFGAADRIHLTRGDRKLTFVKAGTAWKIVEPIKADAEDALTEFVQSLYRLRADEIVAGKDADPKAYGLDSPIAEWSVKNGDREQIGLILGDEEKGGSRRYARFRSGGPVFLLNKKQSAMTLAEYRNRKAWGPLDAAQVEGVTATGEIGDFTLSKRGTKWSVKGRPDETVDVAAVTDLLDALASLKVERYVADEKGNRKLFGLDPPTSTIEIATPAGSRTLWIGRVEGESKRRYAAVAGTDIVFVIGEADAARLTRPAASYWRANP